MARERQFRSAVTSFMIDERLACAEALLRRNGLTPGMRDKLVRLRDLLAEDARLRRQGPCKRLERVEALLSWSDRGADLSNIIVSSGRS